MNLRHWFRVAAVVVSIAVFPAAVLAEQPFAGCLDEFWVGQPPVAVGRGVADALFATHFATLYSEQTETPLYSAEHLTPDQIQAAIRRRRVDEFHEVGRLPAAVASTLEDYRRSGYDRGHMAPNGDMPDAKSQWESFALSNMVPQNADDNRNLWADVEMAVRELVLAGGDSVYVVTGPIFGPDDPPPLHGRVQVPELLFKAVYDETAGIAGVYVAQNAPGYRCWSMSLDQFTATYGIQPFPGLSGAVVALRGRIPPPIMERRSFSDNGSPARGRHLETLQRFAQGGGNPRKAA